MGRINFISKPLVIFLACFGIHSTALSEGVSSTHNMGGKAAVDKVNCDTKFQNAKQQMERQGNIDMSGLSEQCSMGKVAEALEPPYYQFIQPCEQQLDRIANSGGACQLADLYIEDDADKINVKKAVRSQMAQAYLKLAKSEKQVQTYRGNCSTAFKRALDMCAANREKAIQSVASRLRCPASDSRQVIDAFKAATSVTISYYACEILNRNVGARADEEYVEVKKLQVEATGVDVTSDLKDI